jgi:AraC-like DNA-binding protein
MQALVRYHWPGNIRELQNVIERAVIISRGPVLNVALTELAPDMASTSTPVAPTAKSAAHESLQSMLQETERNQILRALEEANGVVAGPNGAAARLGVKRTTLQIKMQKLGIRISRTAVDGHKRNESLWTTPPFQDTHQHDPLQYQKHLRLQEARRLMLTDATDASAAAYHVGYASRSQFTHGYSRLFGTPPFRDAEQIRQQSQPAEL